MRYFLAIVSLLTVFSLSILTAAEESASSQSVPKVPAQENAAPKTDEAQSPDSAKSEEGAASESENADEPSEPDESASDESKNPALIADDLAGTIAEAVNESSAEDLLNLATEAKMSAESVLDLTKVVAFCIEAEKKGLDESSLEYCRQLKLSSQLERGLALANMFMGDTLSVRDLPHGWETIKSMALDDLETSVESMPDLTLAQLAIGRLQMLPGGDEQKARDALDKAIETAAGVEPQVMAEALKYRSILASNSDEGLGYVRRAMELSGENPVLFSLLATRLSEVHQDAEALKAIDEALRLAPENKDYKKAKAFVLAALEQYDEAEKLFDEATADSADDLMTQMEKGQFFSSIRQNDKAIELFSQLIDKFDSIPSLYYLRGALYAQEKEYRKAMKDVNQALRIDPTFTEAIQLKGVIYLQQKKTAEAVRLFETLKNRDPENAQTVTQLAYAQAQNDDFSGAMKTLAPLFEANPDSAELLRCRGDIELMYGRFGEAITTYEKILELDPNDSGALNNYSWLLATAPDDTVRNGEKALELAKAAAEKTNYKEAHILSTLGAAYAELGNFDEALKWSNQAVELGEKEKNDRLDDLKKEGESYKKKEPWRETPEKAGVAVEEPKDENADSQPKENNEFF